MIRPVTEAVAAILEEGGKPPGPAHPPAETALAFCGRRAWRGGGEIEVTSVLGICGAPDPGGCGGETKISNKRPTFPHPHTQSLE